MRGRAAVGRRGFWARQPRTEQRALCSTRWCFTWGRVGEEGGPFCWPHEGWCRHGRAASAVGTSGREKLPWLSVGPRRQPKCTDQLGAPGRGFMGHSVPWADSWREMRPFLSWGSAGLPGTGQRVPSRLLAGTVLALEVTGAGAGCGLRAGRRGSGPGSPELQGSVGGHPGDGVRSRTCPGWRCLGGRPRYLSG